MVRWLWQLSHQLHLKAAKTRAQMLVKTRAAAGIVLDETAMVVAVPKANEIRHVNGASVNQGQIVRKDLIDHHVQPAMK